MKNMRKEIPLFKSEEQEREFWAKNFPLDYMDVHAVEQGVFRILLLIEALISVVVQTRLKQMDDVIILAHG